MKGIERVRLTFLGTRGEIEMRSRRHRRHSAMLVEDGAARIMVDCGTDWRDRLAAIAPTAIVLTHGHADHAQGLAGGAACPVYATPATWRLIRRYPIAMRRTIPPGKRMTIQGIRFEAFAVEHSLRAPAVGYRITAGATAIFYVPDVTAIHDRRRALAGVTLYIGDGASLTHPILRRRDHRLVGHSTVRAQLGWCAAAGVAHALFTHCGSQIVGGKPWQAAWSVRRMGRERGVSAALAYDGLRLSLPRGGPTARMPLHQAHGHCHANRRSHAAARSRRRSETATG